MGIRMQYTLSGRLCNKSLEEFSDMKDSSFTPGGFAIDAPIHEKTICVPFDWCSYSASVNEDGTMTVIHGEKTFFSVDAENKLDDCYEETWAALGINKEDLTPEAMAKTTAIRDFAIDYWPVPEEQDPDDELYIKRLCFLDDDGTEYPVNDAVLKAAGNILKL